MNIDRDIHVNKICNLNVNIDRDIHANVDVNIIPYILKLQLVSIIAFSKVTL